MHQLCANAFIFKDPWHCIWMRKAACVLQLCMWNNVPIGRGNTKAVPARWSINRQIELHLHISLPHCKDTILNIRNKYSQKRKWAASVPISTFKCLWAIYISHDRSAYSAAGKYMDRSWEYMKIAHRHMNVEIGCFFHVSRLSVHYCHVHCFSRSVSPVIRHIMGGHKADCRNRDDSSRVTL